METATGDKSYVSMAQHRCLVCACLYDTGEILMDTRLRNTFDRHTITGSGLCPEHQKMYDDGYVALVGVDESKSTIRKGKMMPDDAYRTGNIAHIRVSAWERLFSCELPMKNGKPLDLVFVSDGVIDLLKSKMPPEDAPSE